MAGIVIWIDPFYHYHKPLSYISYVSGADVYSNDGKLKHFDYDTLTIGTSMAMNFRKEKVDTILGGNFAEMYIILEKALRSSMKVWKLRLRHIRI